jgi:hypothetical protein
MVALAKTIPIPSFSPQYARARARTCGETPTTISMVSLACFLGILAAVALWEMLAPRRPQAVGRLLRWPNRLGLVVLDTVIVRLLFPLAGFRIFVAETAHARSWVCEAEPIRPDDRRSNNKGTFGIIL